MSIVSIPVFIENASFTQTIVLDGINYKMRIYWNVRDEHWYFSLYLPDDTPVLTGIKMPVNYTLISSFFGENVPPGDFILFDESGNNEPCGRDELGDRCILLYISGDDEIIITSLEVA